jgi:hypothetical protein
MAHGKRLSLENQGLPEVGNHKNLWLRKTHGKRLNFENQSIPEMGVLKAFF